MVTHRPARPSWMRYCPYQFAKFELVWELPIRTQCLDLPTGSTRPRSNMGFKLTGHHGHHPLSSCTPQYSPLQISHNKYDPFASNVRYLTHQGMSWIISGIYSVWPTQASHNGEQKQGLKNCNEISSNTNIYILFIFYLESCLFYSEYNFTKM